MEKKVKKVKKAVKVAKKVSKKVKFYEFVTQPSKFDFRRVVNEVQNDEPDVFGILLTMRHSMNATLVLFNKFLDEFYEDDKIIVGVEALGPQWGYQMSATIVQTPDVDKLGFCHDDSIESSNYSIMNVSIHVIGDIMKQLYTAVQFLYTEITDSEETEKPKKSEKYRDVVKIKVLPLREKDFIKKVK